MTTESEDYHSMTELECFMQAAHDSDVEIKCFGKDGVILSGISELEDDIDDIDNNEPIDHENFYIDNPAANTSDLYYILHDQHKSSKSKSNSKSIKSSTRKSRKNIKNLIKNLCEAPHLYIQQQQFRSNDSSFHALINYFVYIDEYLSYKYFYELSLPLIIEIPLIFGTFLFNQISVLLVIILTTYLSQEIQFGIFTFIASLISFVIMQFCSYFKIFPFRSLPDIINNTDEYGFNIKRSINIRYLYYRNKDQNVSSFPDYNCVNVLIFTLSWHLYANNMNHIEYQWIIFMFIPYILFSRCYFAFNYIFDGIWSALFGVIIVYGLNLIIPQTFLIISDEIIREIASNMFT